MRSLGQVPVSACAVKGGLWYGAATTVPDDDDFDLFGSKEGPSDLSALLADIHQEASARAEPAPLPGLVESGPSGTAERRVQADRREGPRSVRPPVLAVTPEAAYGLVGEKPWEVMAYAARVLSIGSRAKERAAVLRDHLATSLEDVNDAHAALGRAAHEEAEASSLLVPAAALAAVRNALDGLDAIAKDRADVSRRVHKQNAMAAARRESAAASLDPAQADQDAHLARLDAAEHAREAARAKNASAEAAFRDAATEGADALRAVDASIDLSRSELRAAEKAHREATMNYAEARRRALLQLGRVAEADQAVEGFRVEERRASRDAERRQDVVLRALREGYSRLGRETFDSGVGAERLVREFAVVRRVRDDRGRTEDLAAALAIRASSFDADAFRRGRILWMAVLAVIVVVMLIVAAVYYP